MILETATITVTPGREDEFVAAVEQQGRVVLERADGWRSLRVLRGIERPSVIQLHLEWETLEDHTEGFRGGPLFGEWRAVIGPFFAEPPQVEHWAPTA
ncbi:MAG: antibiotic biosynthesis monooxygenase [Candidatus Nanopelagicales bacterium]|jgi:heme-degrading monooxygenase HmoA|nr:antibiotic biosynthesis monooxygenase [Candidatus Nanopelagicales bacterium]